MKKRTKSNLLLSLQSLGIIFGIFFAMAFACRDNRETGTEGENPRQNKTTDQALPPGQYAFMSITTFREDGTSKTSTNLTGSLALSGSGKYEHDLWMGNAPFGCGPGTYQTSGSKLALKPDPSVGCEGLDYNFLYDEQQNRLSLVTDDRTTTLLLCQVGENDCFKMK
ncbi:MAG: hypothetical protein LH614_22680 [Pyrinomonadaceae bacterium]|nr:hypothetical protein [Pyrinomonadaceae bacterium]